MHNVKKKVNILLQSHSSLNACAHIQEYDQMELQTKFCKKDIYKNQKARAAKWHIKIELLWATPPKIAACVWNDMRGVNNDRIVFFVELFIEQTDKLFIEYN